MGSIVQSLFSACIAGLLVWYMMRRSGASGATASTTTEIENLRAVVEDLTAALERKAEAAEQRLAKLISEANAVQSVLDRTLTNVGAQVVKSDPGHRVANEHPVVEAPPPAPRALPETPPAIRSMPVEELQAREFHPPPSTPSPAFVPEAPAGYSRSTDGGLLAVPPSNGFGAANIKPAVQPVEPAPPDVADVEVANATVDTRHVAPAPEPEVESRPPVAAAEPKETVADIVAERPSLPPVGKTPDKAEQEAKVMSLVARGITDSVDIARQTGLTRGEVELILTLHNLHMAPSAGVWVDPPPPVAAAAIAAELADQPPKSPDEVVVDPNDRYAAIYQLIASGITNSVEIARRTGLGRGEVELHMGLHARKVL